MKRIILAVITLATIAGCSSQKGTNYHFNGKASAEIKSELISPMCAISYFAFTKEGLEMAKANKPGTEDLEKFLSKPIESYTPFVLNISHNKASFNGGAHVTIENGQIDLGTLLKGTSSNEPAKVIINENQVILDTSKESTPFSGCAYVFTKK